DISVEVHPPEKVKAGTYKIPIKAATHSTSAEMQLEAVITGSYGIELSTPSGLLSTDVTAGDKKTLVLKVTNTGTADLHEISLSANPPVNWEVTFEPKQINKLAAGQSMEVTATIHADSKAIAGDYVVGMTASSPEDSSEAQFRVAVKTSLLWGWLGVLIIAAVIAAVYYLFRQYGRR
ncbi:NEW3 domain-containing protein, partial [Frankia sp. Cpl3]|nr:NEW3 domain-containing protein [Frankia sp. Cpl3]